MKEEEKATGELFGKLFSAYDTERYLASMELLGERFRANDFPLEWFKGKDCLDAGCGGGRYTLALSKFGAKLAVGMDISAEAIRDAQQRASELKLTNVKFRVASADNIPFEDQSFDCVLFSGVLQHMAKPLQALNELARVLRPGGMLYLLVYATEGVRWPLVQMLRPIAQSIGFEGMDRALTAAGLPVNKRRTYLDDLFVPYIDFYSWECLSGLLEERGFQNIKRWDKGRFDHEENIETYLGDLEGFLTLFSAAREHSDAPDSDPIRLLLQEGTNLCSTVVEYVRQVRRLVASGNMTAEEAQSMVIGQGHHRVVAWKK